MRRFAFLRGRTDFQSVRISRTDWKSVLRNDGLLAALIGTALSFIFWSGLWQGGGLIGGDLYTYYFPQKAFLADRLAHGELPLWNNRTGHGYPLVAESQTAPFYPPHLLLYALFDVNTAYNAVQIGHYILAFVLTWMYVRRLGFSAWSAGLAGLVYTYGWFPPRICLEWTIIGGVWLPLAFWCVEGYLATHWWRYWILLSITLALQMLAGHFNLAFLTQLALVVYIPVRLWMLPPLGGGGGGRVPFTERFLNLLRDPSLAVLFFAIVLSFALAAVQIAPTWELKQLSQRAAVGDTHNPGYGHLPFWYWTQVIAPWFWYVDDVDLNKALPPGAARTNQIEAHLYFGLVPVGLLLHGFLSGWKIGGTGAGRANRPRYVVTQDRRLLLWLGLGLAALIYTPGWLLPITQHLPGFAFFAGPGRFGIITTLAVAVLSAASLDNLLAARPPRARVVLAITILAATTLDLWLVCRLWTDAERVRYATIVPDPPINHLAESPVRKILASHDGPVRLFCRGPNLANLLGVASTPPYLGIGPSAYYDPETVRPGPLPEDGPPTPAQITWLQLAGVTHLLSFSPLDLSAWPVTPLWSGYDPFLNRAWARGEPFFLYTLNDSRGRIAWETARPNDTAHITEYRANRVSIEATSESGGTLVLTDLAYPGWQVTVDGGAVEPLIVETMYRGVPVAPGQHVVVWSYRPRSLLMGAIMTVVMCIVLSTLGHIRYWHPQWCARLTRAISSRFNSVRPERGRRP